MFEPIREDENGLHYEEVRAILLEVGDKWRELVWEPLSTDGNFDQLYHADRDAFLYNRRVFVRVEEHPIKALTWQIEPDVIGWMMDNPPCDECKPIAELYLYAKGISAGASPWLLFQYIIGVAQTSQGMGLNSLMGIGDNDAVILGDALIAWGNLRYIVEPFIDLILEHGGEEG
jgi:hypothetical protein